jgi:hypothetical protein
MRGRSRAPPAGLRPDRTFRRAARDRYRWNQLDVAEARRPAFAKASAGRPASTIDPRHTIDNSGSGLVWLGRVAPPSPRLPRAGPGFASGNTVTRSHTAARGNGFARRVSVSTYRGGAPQHHRSAARDLSLNRSVPTLAVLRPPSRRRTPCDPAPEVTSGRGIGPASGRRCGRCSPSCRR